MLLNSTLIGWETLKIGNYWFGNIWSALDWIRLGIITEKECYTLTTIWEESNKIIIEVPEYPGYIRDKSIPFKAWNKSI